MLDFVLKFRLAHALIAENHHKSGFICLSICFEQLSAVLASQRMTLLYVLNAALEVSTDFELPEILALLFRYLHGLAKIQLGPRHPATEIARRFGVLESVHHGDVLGLMRRLQADSDHSERALETAFSVYDKSVEVWSDGSENVIGGLQGLLSGWELVQQSYIMTLWLRMRVAIAMLDQGQTDSMEEMLKAEYPAFELPLKEPKKVSLILQCYRIRGDMWLRDGLLGTAETIFQKGLQLADGTWGIGSQVSLGFDDKIRQVLLLRNGGKAAAPSM